METTTSDNGQATKTTRKRKEWVYKSDYNLLERKYKILSWLTVAGWLGFVIALKYAL